MTAAARTVGKALTERITGIGPSRIRSAAAATIVGAAGAVATYRLLRAGA